MTSDRLPFNWLRHVLASCLTLTCLALASPVAQVRGQGQSDLPGASEGPPSPRIEASLLLVGSDWSTGDTAGRVEADVKVFFAQADLPSELRSAMPRDAATMLFPEGLVTVYRDRDLDELRQWLVKHGLVREEILIPGETPKGLPPVAVGTLDMKRIPLPPLDPPDARPGRKWQASWSVRIGLNPPPSYPGGAMGSGPGMPGGLPGAAMPGMPGMGMPMAGPSGGEAGVPGITMIAVERKLSMQESVAFPIVSVIGEEELFRTIAGFRLEPGEAAILPWYFSDTERGLRQWARDQGLDPLIVVRVRPPETAVANDALKRRAGSGDSADASGAAPGTDRTRTANADGPQLPRPLRVAVPQVFGEPGLAGNRFAWAIQGLAGRRTTMSSMSGAGKADDAPGMTGPQPAATPATMVPLADDKLRLVPLQKNSAQQVIGLLRQLFHQDLTLAVDERTNSLIVYGARADDVVRLIELLESAGESAAKLEPLTNHDDLAAARRAFSEAERAANRLAAEVRSKQHDASQRSAGQQQLQAAVREAFERRLALQRLEVAQLEQRLQAVARNLGQREKLADAIIQKRVEDLLRNPDLQWEPASAEPPAQGRPTAAGDEYSRTGAAPPVAPTPPAQPKADPESALSGGMTVGPPDSSFRFKSPSEFQQTLRDAAALVNQMQTALAQYESPTPGTELPGRSSTIAAQLKAQLQTANERLALARKEYLAQLQLLEIELQDAQSQLRLAESSLARLRTLFERGVIPQGDVDMAQAALSRATSRSQRAKLLYDLYRQADPIRNWEGAEAGVGESAALAAARRQSAENLRMIMVAMHRYADQHRRFPPAVVLGKDGQGNVPHSWRVELLPFLDQQALYDQYQFDEPWDSPANQRVLARMPAVFRSPLDDPQATHSSYFVVVGQNASGTDESSGAPGGSSSAASDGSFGDGAAGAGVPGQGGVEASAGLLPALGPHRTMFTGPEGTRFAEITDGTSNTIAVVEARRPIPWTKPEDLVMSIGQPLPALGGWFMQGWHAGYADASVRFLASDKDEPTIRGLLTIADGQNVQAELAVLSDTAAGLELRVFASQPTEGGSPTASPHQLRELRQRLASGQFDFKGEFPFCWRKLADGVNATGITAERGEDTYVLLAASDSDHAVSWPQLQDHIHTLRFSVVEGQKTLSVEFDAEAALRLRDVSRSNQGNRLAIVVGGEVLAAPVIRDEIGGSVQITGDFTPQQWSRLNQALSGP